jgi:hypothetical protein
MPGTTQHDDLWANSRLLGGVTKVRRARCRDRGEQAGDYLRIMAKNIHNSQGSA